MRGPPAREPGPVPPFGATDAWWALGARLAVSDGVHRPSRFSAALSAHLPTVTGAHVVDVGCGAGSVSVAALARGAAHAVAMDRDPAALLDTRANVTAVLGHAAARRLALLESDWAHLGLLRCDIAIANPHQRPSALLAAVAPAERHLHEGAGDDGADAIRALLHHGRADVMVLTLSSLLPVGGHDLVTSRFTSAERLHDVTVEHDPVWAPLVGDTAPSVGIWRFSV
jgi:methylase of polypeptide subunit release factors